jgi:hypothetical protein
MKNFLLGALLFLAPFCVAQVTVQVSAPLAQSTGSTPIQVQATASSSHPITGWVVYLDNADVYTGPAAGTISTSLSASKGAHELVIRAWDSTGAYGTQTLQTTVSATPASIPVSVQLSAPAANSTVSSPIQLQATASSSHPITGWQVYLDSAIVYTGPATGTISAAINASQGAHQIIARAWDSTGAFADQTIQATVASTVAPAPTASNPLPTPPATAIVFSKIEQMTTGWGSCNTAACAGGTGEGTYWQAFTQATPSLSGQSMEMFQDGSWSNALFYRHLGANDNATNFLWDFNVQVDSASLSGAQALEYDAFQFVGGYNYMIGTECNYAAGVWDTWDEATGHWLHTTIPCKPFAAGTWHHIQWYMTTDHSGHTYTYKTLVVDGVVYNLNQTQPAKYLAWGDNVGVQWQLDVNASGTGYHEWVDEATLTIW